MGAIVGFFLYSLIAGFFGDTWSVEAGGPALVIYSPIFVPLLVGAISGLVGNVGASIIASIVSGVLYLIVGVLILIIGGVFSAGFGGLALLFGLAGLLCGGGTIIVVIISN